MEVLFKQRFLTLSYDSDKKCLIQTWTSFCNSEEFRAGQMKTVECFAQKSCKNFISDTTNAGLLKKEDTDWVTEFITPQLINSGMKKFNLVMPASVFAQKTVRNLDQVEKESHRDLLQFYPNLKSALEAI